MLLVPYAGIYWGWWLGFLENPAVDAFLVTTLLQGIRKKTSVNRYTLLWKVLLVVTLIWGGWALTEYVFNFSKWRDQIYILPIVALGVAIAKSKEWLRILPYLALLAFVFLIWQYGESTVNFICNTFDIGNSATLEKGSGSGYGYATIGLSASFDWFVFKMPGLVLLASVLAVPPSFNGIKRILKKFMSSNKMSR